MTINSFELIAQNSLYNELKKEISFAEKWQKKDAEKTLKRMNHALKKMQKSNYTYGEWRIQDIIGDIHYQESRFDKSLEAYQITIALAEKIDTAKYKGVGYHNLAKTYVRLGRLKNAEEMALAAKSIFIAENLKNWEASIYGNLGNIYTQSGRAEEGLNVYRIAYEIYDSLGIEEKTMTMNFNIGYFYLMQGDGETAIPYIKKGLDYDLRNKQKDGIAMGFGNLAYANSLMGNYAEAFKNYQHSIDTAQKYNLSQIEYVTYMDMSETYSKSGDYQQALTYLTKHYALKDSIIGAEAQQNINELEIKFATQEQETENQILQKEKRLQQIQIWGLIIGFILLGTIAFLAIQRMYSDIRKKQELIDKNAEIHQLEKQLIENQLVQKKLEQEKTLEELRYKNQRLTDFALDITQKNKIAETLNNELDAIEDMKIPKTARTKLRNLRQFIDTNLQINKEVTAFQENFDVVLVEFNQKLKKQFPKLTKKDIILCGFLRLGLQSKEVATIRNISQNAVKMARYRLRKKLNLVAEDDIEAFLKSV